MGGPLFEKNPIKTNVTIPHQIRHEFQHSKWTPLKTSSFFMYTKQNLQLVLCVCVCVCACMCACVCGCVGRGVVIKNEREVCARCARVYASASHAHTLSLSLCGYQCVRPRCVFCASKRLYG
mmetsp:Transcript_97346/g.156969  ORF Transcript_97346/g.156969 Transcript_97346/m.156969 type:complete len:122 (+) Transcript_97346:928-1293(+)